MTDLAPTAKEPFAIVPTLDGYLQLEDRLTQLEARIPAAGETVEAELVADDSALHARLDRHRADLDAVKSAMNELIRYVQLNVPTASPAAPPATTSPESPL